MAQFLQALVMMAAACMECAFVGDVDEASQAALEEVLGAWSTKCLKEEASQAFCLFVQSQKTSIYFACAQIARRLCFARIA